MGYIFVFISIFTNALKGFCSKKISSNINATADCINLNIIRIFICCVFSAAMMLIKNGISYFSLNIPELMICALAGLMLAVNITCWTLAIKSEAYMLVSASASSGFVIPCIFGLFLFGETFTLFKSIAFMLIVVSLYFLLRYQVSFNGRITKMQYLLLALVLISQGINQTTQKMFAFYAPDKDASSYTFYSFIFTLVFLLIFKLKYKSKSSTEIKKQIKLNLHYIILMALGLFGTSYFQSLAAVSIDAIILYPLINALSLIAGSAMSSLFFKEKMNRDCVIGIVLVFFALLFSRF